MRLIESRKVAAFQSVDGIGSQALAWPDGYKFEWLGEEQLTRSSMAQEKGRLANFVSRIDQGHQVAGFLDAEGNVASYLWVSHGPTVAPFEGGLRLDVEPDHIYIWDCRTDVKHQRRGLYVSGLKCLLGQAHAKGRSVQIVSRVQNISSVKAIRMSGFADVGTMRIFGLDRLRLTQFGFLIGVRLKGQTIRFPTLVDGADRAS